MGQITLKERRTYILVITLRLLDDAVENLFGHGRDCSQPENPATADGQANVALSHTWLLENLYSTAAGVPHAALSPGSGARPRRAKPRTFYLDAIKISN